MLECYCHIEHRILSWQSVNSRVTTQSSEKTYFELHRYRNKEIYTPFKKFVKEYFKIDICMGRVLFISLVCGVRYL